MHKVLIIDDEKDICFLISEILKDEDYIVSSALNSDEAIKKFSENKFIQDYCLDGLDKKLTNRIERITFCRNYLLEKLRNLYSDTENYIYISADFDIDLFISLRPAKCITESIKILFLSRFLKISFNADKFLKSALIKISFLSINSILSLKKFFILSKHLDELFASLSITISL